MSEPVCDRCGCKHFIIEREEKLANGSVRTVAHCRHCGARKIFTQSAEQAKESGSGKT
jgi:hypothetical protein